MRANTPTRSRTDTRVHRASDPLPARALLPEACGKLERTAACLRRPWAGLCRAARARVMTMLSFPTSRPRREGLRVHTYLLFVLLGMRQHGGHVEHDLVPLVHGVHRAYPRGVVCKTQAHVSRARGVLGPEGDGLYVRTRASPESPQPHSSFWIIHLGEAALRVPPTRGTPLPPPLSSPAV